MSRHHVPQKFRGSLLAELESARMRLSVAIALEAKSTPRERWREYLETAEQMCRCIKKLRKAGAESLGDPRGWDGALETLQDLPVPVRASRLYEILQEIAGRVE